MSTFVKLEELEVYKLARRLSGTGWEIYRKLSWEGKKAGGDQFIDSTDSIGANIAEGYFRFHYLDKVKFYYVSRGSLAEASKHWLELLYERKLIQEEEYQGYKKVADQLSLRLNNFIKTTYQSKALNKAL